MRFINCEADGRQMLAARRGDDLVDLTNVASQFGGTLLNIIAGKGYEAVKAAASNAAASDLLDEAQITYLPPIPNPPKIICVGANYMDHANEASLEVLEYPVLFSRWASNLIGHGQPMHVPTCSEQLDWEGELVVVIGERCKNVPKERAAEVIAGYSIFNDGSVRDYQLKSHQWTIGKNFDATGPFGPEFVTADELPECGRGLRLQTRLNGEIVQNANTDDMIFPVDRLVEILSEAVTLEPGDLIVSGTPGGVGLFHDPPLWMKDGDTIEVEIDGLGILSNPVVAENAAASRSAAE